MANPLAAPGATGTVISAADVTQFYTLFNNYKCRATITAAQNNIGNADVKVALDTAANDPNGNFNTSTNTYTVPVTGTFLVSGGIAVSAASGLTIQALTIDVNGAVAAEMQGPTQSGTIGGAWQVNYLGKLTAGDLVTLHATITNGTTINVSTANNLTFMSIQCFGN